jgi:hypothetical protein
MEGLALDTSTDKLHGFLQSPLTDGSTPYSVTGKSELIERFARFTRWTEFDPTTGKAGKMYAYPLDASEYQDGRTGNAKLGDVVALGNGKFIVIEQGAAPSGKVFNKLMLVEIGAATDISAAAFNATTSDLEKSSMGGAAVNGADWKAVTTLKKTLLLDLNAIGWLAEKAEGLTIVDGNTLALANDNDFGLKTKVFDASGKALKTPTSPSAMSMQMASIVTSSAAGCNAANSIRVARGTDGTSKPPVADQVWQSADVVLMRPHHAETIFRDPVLAAGRAAVRCRYGGGFHHQRQQQQRAIAGQQSDRFGYGQRRAERQRQHGGGHHHRQ